jgi:hypothetical protein
MWCLQWFLIINLMVGLDMAIYRLIVISSLKDARFSLQIFVFSLIISYTYKNISQFELTD